jgi:CO/xanthine dehydrogenase Mo-binding subunit
VGNPVWGASEAEVEEAFARADHVFEHTFRTPVQHQGYLEPHACIVELDENQVAHIWASNKAPFLLLDYLRLGLGLQREQVEIHMLPLGGDFGGKGSFMDIPLAYFLAKATGKPVKLVMTYTEELIAANPRHSAVITVKTGFDKSGKIVARRTRSIYNSGAYAAFKPAPDATLPGIRGGSLGCYEVPVFRIEGHMVYTNTVPCGHMRAPGEAQPLHSVECHMDLCAREMGMDPLELRLINAPHEPRKTPSGQPGTAPKAREVLREAAKAIGLHEPRPEGVGRGIALVEVGNSLGDYQMGMSIERGSGQVVVHTPMIENGAGMLTVFRKMAADELGLSVSQVTIDQTTEGIEYDRGVGGSRITRLIGRMIAMLAEKLEARLAELVAGEFGHEADQIVREPGGFRTPDGKFLSVAEAASLSPTDLDEMLRYQPDQFDVVEVFVAIGVEAQVDRETGQVKPTRIVSAHEVGRIINPVMHQGQIDGGLSQGFGYALCEGLQFDEGRVTTANLGDYKLPVAVDLPEMETILLPPDLSLGITPIGEGPNCAMSAAIVNAVVDVVGHQVQIPISPEVLALGSR